MKTIYLTKDSILSLCRDVIDENIKFFDEDSLDMILEWVKDPEQCLEFSDKLACIVARICHGHVFVDGNKRAAVLIGAYFLTVNGYENVLDRYVEVMGLISNHVRNCGIDTPLLSDIFKSVLDGDTEFPYDLKMRLLLAMDEDLEKPCDEEAYRLPLYFEKQTKLTERADNRNSVDVHANQYPCLKLVHNDNWNDYNHYTWFTLWVLYDDEYMECIGDVKIMHRTLEVYEAMEDSFKQLDSNFCSLGMDVDYYQSMLREMGRIKAYAILEALNDCAINERIYEDFNGTDTFRESLFRDLSSQKALKEAKFIMEGKDMDDAYSFRYSFTPIYNEDVTVNWDVKLLYDCRPYKRTMAIIGENGVGKTQLLANTVESLVNSDTDKLSNVPLFSSIIVICSSTFDAYYKIDKENGQIPLTVLDVVQSGTTYDNLFNSIKIIINRGTFYSDGEMLLIREHYVQLLDAQLGKNITKDLILMELVQSDKGIPTHKPKVNTDKLHELVDILSTGQLQIFSLITHVCANIHLNTFIVLDEPEVHLHPRLVSNFFIVLNQLLHKFESYAIIATHSPLVVKECVKQNVYKMLRTKENVPLIGTVPFNTFGEDLTTLYENIFDLDEREGYFYQTVSAVAGHRQPSYKKVIDKLAEEGVDLTLSGRNMVRDMIMNLNNENKES